MQVAYKRTLDGKEFTKDIACLFKPEFDSTEIYKAASLGAWTVKTYYSDKAPSFMPLELFANGTGKYYNSTLNTTHLITWYITMTNNGYYLQEKGYWRPVLETLPRTRLTYPITMFKIFGDKDPTITAQEFFKN